MSRAQVFAQPQGPRSTFPRPAERTVRNSAGAEEHVPEPRTLYVDRALLLWPRLDRARLLRVAGDPRRIAEIVSRRTTHSVETILVMLERDTTTPRATTEIGTGFDSGPLANARAAMRFVKHDRDEGHGIAHRRPA
jgi:hypothetical protein